MKDVSPEEAHNYILGYTCANDVTARDLQFRDGQWMRSKSFDTFCPLGPWLETELDPTDLAIRLYLNGKVRQDDRTRQMVYNPYELLSYISKNMTIDAGDPFDRYACRLREMRVGDEVAVEIEGIGCLRNTVRAPGEEAKN
jgi:2-keto-4-pentenoate hydratase/2-oxohepta-3-ene-1,7-dioic acid hydratase in catechol pathway